MRKLLFIALAFAACLLFPDGREEASAVDAVSVSVEFTAGNEQRGGDDTHDFQRVVQSVPDAEQSRGEGCNRRNQLSSSSLFQGVLQLVRYVVVRI